jgi:Amidohydrolase
MSLPRGTVWRSLLADPVQAAHVLGKLLSRLGEDRDLWGTDSVWYGPPQTQIMAFRAFEISEEFQQRYGYPALTDTVKAKVLGLNAARLWGLDPHATRCALAADTSRPRRCMARTAERGSACLCGPFPPDLRPLRDQELVGASQAAQFRHGLPSRLVLRALALGRAYRHPGDLG